MNKKIRNVWMLTMLSAVVLIVLQGYWLYHEMGYSLSQREKSAIVAIDKSMEIYSDMVYAEYREDNRGWVVTALAGKDKFPVTSISSPRIKTRNGVNVIPDDVRIETDTFDLPQLTQTDASMAISKYIAEKKTPLQMARLDSIISKETGRNDLSLRVEKTSDFQFFPDTISHATIFGEPLVYRYPFNPLAHRSLVITMPIDISPILANMRWQLAATLLLTILLIVSMGYQIKVLLHQHKIEKLRSDFVHTMIHELKRPVQMLKMCISIFGNDSNSEMTTIVKEEADNLTAYLAKLREVIRAEEHIPLSLREFNIRQMIDSQTSIFQRSHTDKDLHIDVDCNLENENMIGDKAQLANVVNNLLENSYKYSGESVNILVSCSNQGNDIALSVADDGIGIPQSERARVFEKFYRGQSSNGKIIPGIGLGLSFVRMIAEAHGGKATLESREDVGTKVTIVIPQKR